MEGQAGNTSAKTAKSLEFFRRLGLYFRPDFLNVQSRSSLLEYSKLAAQEPARVFAGGTTAVVDRAARNTWQVPLDEDADALADRIGALCPDLARHFAEPLSGHEGPSLLRYQPGGFYEAHVDRAGEDETHIAPARRRVSIVIFINPGDYDGGALTLYGLIDDPAWKTFGFAIEPSPGLLVAFPSHIVHEVTPVTAGDRFTIVDWFTA
jgi:PKHD-type hydroxylase